MQPTAGLIPLALRLMPDVSQTSTGSPTQAMNPILLHFLSAFETSFQPPVPYRGRGGANWLVSKVWSDYMREWLPQHYRVRYEYPLAHGRRLDAAIWSNSENASQRRQGMDIALEWEWDNGKVAADFLRGDFRKLFDVDAACGLAVVQTRVDGKRGTHHADETIRDLQRLSAQYRQDSRSVALIEVRRVRHYRARVDFVCYSQDLGGSAPRLMPHVRRLEKCRPSSFHEAIPGVVRSQWRGQVSAGWLHFHHLEG
jgi:hypothetical protein